MMEKGIEHLAVLLVCIYIKALFVIYYTLFSNTIGSKNNNSQKVLVVLLMLRAKRIF